MGRSFSVFLFCFAMDPMFHYLNQIPRVHAVEAYVDDTTILGDAQSLDWIRKVSDTYRKMSTAGFVVDSHTCYRALQNSVMKFAPVKLTDEELLSKWPEVVASRSYSTAYEAMRGNSNPSYNTLVIRMGRTRLRTHPCSDNSADTVAVNYNFTQVTEILQGRDMHSVGVLGTHPRVPVRVSHMLSPTLHFVRPLRRTWNC